jgi:nucleotide-binding universal stress UspA family protein
VRIAIASNIPLETESGFQGEAQPLQIKGILVATDYSEQATLALKIAARVARRFHSRLHLLYVEAGQVYSPSAGLPSPLLEAVDITVARERLHEYAAAIPEVRVLKHEEIVSSGLASAALYETAATKGVDLVVVGSHGRSGLRKVVLGSVAEAAVRGLHCPVLVIGPRCVLPSHRLKSILLVTGLSSTSRHAAGCAISIARETGAMLTVAHVLPEHLAEHDMLGFNAWQSAAKEMRQLVSRHLLLPHQVHFEIHTGLASTEIIRVAEERKAGLVVLGTNANGPLTDHIPWATLSSVIRESRCPVLGVPRES